MKPIKIIKKLYQAINDEPYFATKDVIIGRNVSFGKNVKFNCKQVRIGDGVVFQDNILIDSDIFEIGDYGTIYSYCFFPGPGDLRIGHNFWLGTASIIDSQGSTHIGNNVGIGAHSQLWTHMKFGDVMYGCRYYKAKPLEIEDDVWIVGHCLISPVKIGARSMAMLGSLITIDMEADHTYAGVPARDVTDKLGSQFKIKSVNERKIFLQNRIEKFATRYKIKNLDNLIQIVTTPSQLSSMDNTIIVFNIADRTYTKRGTNIEHKLIRFLLPEAKFIPVTG